MQGRYAAGGVCVHRCAVQVALQSTRAIHCMTAEIWVNVVKHMNTKTEQEVQCNCTCCSGLAHSHQQM